MTDVVVNIGGIERFITIPVVGSDKFLQSFLTSCYVNFRNYFSTSERKMTVELGCNSTRDGSAKYTMLEELADEFIYHLYIFSKTNNFMLNGLDGIDGGSFKINIIAYEELRSDQNWFNLNKDKWVVLLNGKPVASGKTREQALNNMLNHSSLNKPFCIFVKGS